MEGCSSEIEVVEPYSLQQTNLQSNLQKHSTTYLELRKSCISLNLGTDGLSNLHLELFCSYATKEEYLIQILGRK